MLCTGGCTIPGIATCFCDTTLGCRGPPGSDSTDCPTGLVCKLDGLEDAGSFWSGHCDTPRYTVNPAGTVTDDLTGLVWQQVPALDPCPGDGTNDSGDPVCTLPHAQAFCESLDLNGPGWRLPTVTELVSLVDRTSSRTDPAIDAEVFPGTISDYFWTATPANQLTGGEWAIDFTQGDVDALQVDFAAHLVRCVR
jgi:hypothetical protein